MFLEARFKSRIRYISGFKTVVGLRGDEAPYALYVQVSTKYIEQ